MGEAKQRGSFEQRKASAKTIKFTNPDDFCLNICTVDNHVQATFSFGNENNQIVLRASDFPSLFHLLVHFSLDSLSLVDDFLKSVNPSLHEEIHLDDDSLRAYFDAYDYDDDDDSVNQDIKDIFLTDLLPLTDKLYSRLIKTTDYKDLSKKDFDSLRSQGFFYNPVRKSFQIPSEFFGFDDD